MAKFFHIGFTFRDGPPKVVEMEPIFNRLADDWLRYAANNWIVWTPRPASDYFYALKPILGINDSMLIAKLDLSERNGWLPQWMGEWMDKKRQLGPPPPPAPPPSDLGGILAGLVDPNPYSFGIGGPGPFSGLGRLLNPPSDPNRKK